MLSISRLQKTVGMAVGLLVLLSGNIPIPQHTDHTFRVYIEDGVEIAKTSERAKYTEPLFTYEPVLQLVQDSTDLESLLYRPGRFTSGLDGCFYVMDRGNHRVAVFDNNGQFIRSFGGEGEGPGTFRILAYQALHDGVLHIRDGNLNRTTRMMLDGTVINILTRPRHTRGARRYVLSNGRQLLLHKRTNYDWNNYWQAGAFTIVDAEMNTLVYAETDSVLIQVYGANPAVEGHTYWLVRFIGYPCSDYSPTHGIYLSDGQTPVINHYNDAGNLVRRIVLDIPSIPVTRKERRGIFAEYNQKVLERTGRQRQMAIASRDNLIFPDVKGWWSEMMIDDHGFIWLAVVADEETKDVQAIGTLCDIISPEGEYLGRTRLPARFDKCVVINGTVCATLTDSELDENKPTVFLIRSAVEGLKYPN